MCENFIIINAVLYALESGFFHSKITKLNILMFNNKRFIATNLHF